MPKNEKLNFVNNFFKKIFLLFLLCFLSSSLFSKTQKIILTGPQNSGSYIFATELSRLWSSSKKNNKSEIVNRVVTSPKRRLRQIFNNGIDLAIVDAKTAHEFIHSFSGLRVLSVLWKNWLYVMGTVPGSFLSLESTKTFLIHDNSVFFAKVWKKLSPKTVFKWFNGKSIPDFDKGFSEEVLVVTGPIVLREINYWLEQFAGIHLLSLDQLIVKSLTSNYKWLITQNVSANTFPYQTDKLTGIAWHPVLVSHKNLSEELALNLLKTIYSQKDSLNPHVLFQNLDIENNIVFRKIYPYHSSAKNMFKFK